MSFLLSSPAHASLPGGARRFGKSTLVLLAAMAALPAVRGQEATALPGEVPASDAGPGWEDFGGVSLEQLMQTPVEFVSGVSKYEQSIRRAPAGVTVYTAADIQNHGWRTLSDVLRNAPGMHIRDDRFYDYVGNRGFTRPYDYNSRTLILLDGHRLNDAVYQQGPVGSDFILDMDMVERVEIIQGPGSSVYGSSAFYGAVNVIPKRGRDLAGGQAALTVGSEPSVKGRVSVGDRTAGGVEYTISATEWWSQGEDDFVLPQDWRNADPVNLTGSEVSDQDQTHHQSVFGSAAWRGFSAEVAYARRRKDVLPPVYYTTVDSTAYGVDDRGYFLLRAAGEPTADSHLSVQASIDYYSYEGRFESSNLLGYVPHVFYSDALSLNTEARWRQDIADRHTLIAGVEYQSNLRQDLGRDNLVTGAPGSRVRESSYYVSPFAQFDWGLTEQLWLSTGARYDYYSTSDERLTPRVGLVWEASAANTFKLLYGESFRVPNLEERYANEAGIVPNPDIGPETNRTYEFIAEHRLNEIWRIDGRLYRVVSDDLIAAVPAGSLLTYDNVQSFVTDGMDVGVGAFFPSGVQVRASATLQNTEDDATGVIVADAPRVLGKLNASAPLGVRWLRLSGELQYVGERKDAGDLQGVVRTADDYLTANLTLRAIQVWHRWDFALSVYNIADATWTDPKNQNQIVSPPRTFAVRAMMNF